MKEIITYQCEFCGLKFNTKEAAIKHESDCEKNPQSLNCNNCTLYLGGFCNAFMPLDHDLFLDTAKVCKYFELKEEV